MKTTRFPLELEGKFIGKGRWELSAPFEYHARKSFVIVVPEKFVTDGASIPKFAFSLVGGRWTGKYVRGAVIHDYLYYSQFILRKTADKIFLEAMKYSGVNFVKRRIMYLAVRLAGWIPWNEQRRKKKW